MSVDALREELARNIDHRDGLLHFHGAFYSDNVRAALDRLERMEAVVTKARSLQLTELFDVFAALDGPNRSDAAIDATTRSCPNAVTWCGGPDRYGDTCAACLATWTEEAKEKK